MVKNKLHIFKILNRELLHKCVTDEQAQLYKSAFLIYGFENGTFFHHQYDALTEYAYELFQDLISKMQKRGKFGTAMSQ